MTVTGPYDESYPPSLWGGGPAPQPPPTITTLTPASVAVADEPPKVVITGTGFDSTLKVWVDEVIFPTGKYLTSTTAEFVPAASHVGTQDIVVMVRGLKSAGAVLTVTATADEPEAQQPPAPAADTAGSDDDAG